MFHDIRLPDDIEKGATGGPLFKTSVMTLSSGVEKRNIDWVRVRGQWECAYGVQRKSDLDLIRAFYMARRGRAIGFRFKDWSDFEAVGQVLGVGDGTVVDFQLVKTYGDIAGSFSRKITRPIGSSLIIKDNAATVSGWTLQPGGIIRFGTAPLTGHTISASFEFDVPVRFNSDQLDFEMAWAGAGSVPSVQITELKE